MLTAWCLLLPMLSMFVVGLPIRGIAARGKALDESAWIQVPFVGLAVTVLVLQFQLYCDIPVNRGVVALAALVICLWPIWLWHGAVRESLRNVPAGVFAVGLVVLTVQALGLIRVGPEDYLGRSWSDQFNYTAMAECFRRLGLNAVFDDIGQQPWLGRVQSLRSLRIGQSVLQAYHGVITRIDTKAQFMPTIMLSCPLLTLALYAAGRKLGLNRRQGAIAGLFGGIVPGVTLLVQESFLSHALAIPLLLVLPTMLSQFAVERSFGAFAAAVFCIGALASIYTEFLILALLMIAGFFVLALVQWRCGWRQSLGFAVLLAAPWLCNPLYVEMTSFLTSPLMTKPGVLTHIYPWAYDVVGFGVVWFGDYCASPNVETKTWYPFVIVTGQVVVACGLTGLLALGVAGVARWWRGNRQLAAGGFDLALALAGLGLIPVVMVLRDKEHHYQFFKLLITVSPLYALGMVALAAWLGRRLISATGWRAAAAAVWLPVLIALAVAGTGTTAIACRSTSGKQWFRTQQQVALSEGFRELRVLLEGMKDEAMLIRPLNYYVGYQQNWALYFARFNKVWLAWPFINDACPVNAQTEFAQFTDLRGLPKTFLVLCPRDGILLMPPKSLPPAEIIWQNSQYTLWRHDGRPWACITDVENPNGCDLPDNRAMWLGDGDTVLHLHASAAGMAHLRLAVRPGPCIKETEEVKVMVQVNDGKPNPLDVSNPTLVTAALLERGHNTITIKVLNSKTRRAGEDSRTLLAQLVLQDFDFWPAPQQPSETASPEGN